MTWLHSHQSYIGSLRVTHSTETNLVSGPTIPPTLQMGRPQGEGLALPTNSLEDTSHRNATVSSPGGGPPTPPLLSECLTSCWEPGARPRSLHTPSTAHPLPVPHRFHGMGFSAREAGTSHGFGNPESIQMVCRIHASIT